jgi:hypothetical protein
MKGGGGGGGGGGVGRLMANAILNFHFDYRHPSLILGGGTKYESSNPRWILMSFQHISMGENDFLNLVVILTLHI